jgi:hypothetical protein
MHSLSLPALRATRRSLLSLLFCGALLLALQPTYVALGASFTLTSCAAADLIAAIDAANANDAPDVITLKAGCTYDAPIC